MPNWCKNHLIVGSAELEDVMELITDKKTKEVTFEKFLPTPPALLDQTSPTPKNADKKELQRLEKKYGATNWYDWRYKNWGVKWDAFRTEWLNDFEVCFETPWGPPILFLINLSKKFPHTQFKIQFADEFLGQYPLGQITITNGEIIDEKGPEEGSEKAQKLTDAIWENEWVNMNHYKNLTSKE